MLDPFSGSSTTGIAANLLSRRFLGIDQESDFLNISKCQREELENYNTVLKYRSKIKDINNFDTFSSNIVSEEMNIDYGDLPF